MSYILDRPLIYRITTHSSTIHLNITWLPTDISDTKQNEYSTIYWPITCITRMATGSTKSILLWYWIYLITQDIQKNKKAILLMNGYEYTWITMWYTEQWRIKMTSWLGDQAEYRLIVSIDHTGNNILWKFWLYDCSYTLITMIYRITTHNSYYTLNIDDL